ncbi:MAG TPA: hypothetical protein VFJ80_07940 [Candidatus Limnocylindrales bacterium]|nr:hypothetical protein [Candidatus Limnocylindrales bacterium]
MTTPRRFEGDLPALLADLYLAGMPDYRDDLVQRIERTPQRPAWTLPERWLPVELVTSRTPAARVPWRQIGVLALIALLLAAALAAYIGSHQARLPAPFGPAGNGFIPFAKSGDIYLGDPVSGGTHPLVTGPGDDKSPVSSPDGTRIAFNRSVPGTAADGTALFDTYVVNVDGSGLSRVSFTPIADSSRLSWAPDSRRLAIIQKVAGTSGCQGPSNCLAGKFDLVDTASGASQTVATVDGLDFVQFRPPDGRELMYRALVDGKWGMFAVGLDGSPVRTLAQPNVPGEMGLSFHAAMYSADGQRIFYEHGDAGGCCQLWVMNADGTGAHEFMPLGPAWDGNAVPSPDGQWVAYWHNPNDGPIHGISIARADETGRLLAAGPVLPGFGHYLWAPDSSKILLFPNDGSSGRAFLIDPHDGSFKTVAWDSDGDLDWQRIALPG